MKLGASYNLFDTEELLESSILSIRDQVDFVHVLYQETSNTGKAASTDMIKIVKELKRKGLIDELEKFKPQLSKGTHWNELKKRNRGLERAKEEGCTHFMSMDSDEFYRGSELASLKKLILEQKIDSTACEVINYFKKPVYQLIYPNQPKHYVSLIFRIRPWVKYRFDRRFPVLVDPTRRMRAGKFYLVPKEELAMHHMTLVRKSIRSKLESSSANELYVSNNIEDYVTYFESWKKGDSVYPPSNHSNFLSIEEVESSFSIPEFK